MPIFSVSELESSLISFFCIRVHFSFILQEEKMARGVPGVGDYSREAIILNISAKGEGRLLFEEMRYLHSLEYLSRLSNLH